VVLDVKMITASDWNPQKTLALCLASHCAGCMIGPWVFIHFKCIGKSDFLFYFISIFQKITLCVSWKKEGLHRITQGWENYERMFIFNVTITNWSALDSLTLMDSISHNPLPGINSHDYIQLLFIYLLVSELDSLVNARTAIAVSHWL